MKKWCFIVCASLALLVGCSSIDCPLNNVVGLKAGLRSAATGASYYCGRNGFRFAESGYRHCEFGTATEVLRHDRHLALSL